MACPWWDDDYIYLNLGRGSKQDDQKGKQLVDHKDKHDVNVKGEKHMYGKHKGGQQQHSGKLKIHGDYNKSGKKGHQSEYQRGLEYGFNKGYEHGHSHCYGNGHDNSSGSKYGDHGQYNSKNVKHGYHGSKYGYDSRDSEHGYEYDDGRSK